MQWYYDITNAYIIFSNIPLIVYTISSVVMATLHIYELYFGFRSTPHSLSIVNKDCNNNISLGVRK